MGGVECWRAGMLRLQRQAGWTVSTNEEGEAVVGLGLPAGALTSGAASGGISAWLFKYSTGTMTWTHLGAVAGTAPSSRYDQSMTTVGEDLYVFGGRTSGEAGGGWATPAACVIRAPGVRGLSGREPALWR